jgi:hypothetical protein
VAPGLVVGVAVAVAEDDDPAVALDDGLSAGVGVDVALTRVVGLGVVVALAAGVIVGVGLVVGVLVGLGVGVGVGVSVGGGGVRIWDVTLKSGDPSSASVIFPVTAQSPMTSLICWLSVSAAVAATNLEIPSGSPQPGLWSADIIACASVDSGYSRASVDTCETRPEIGLSEKTAFRS